MLKSVSDGAEGQKGCFLLRSWENIQTDGASMQNLLILLILIAVRSITSLMTTGTQKQKEEPLYLSKVGLLSENALFQEHSDAHLHT